MDLEDKVMVMLPSEHQMKDRVIIDLGDGKTILGEVITITFTEYGRVMYDIYCYLSEYNTVLKGIDELYIKKYNGSIRK